MLGLAAPWLLLLAPLPLLARRLMPPRGGQGAGLRVPGAVAEALRPGLGTALALAGGRLLPGLVWLGLVLALAGPQVIEPTPAIGAQGRDLMLAVDLSGSMEQTDFVLDGAPARRLDVVRREAAAFVRGRAGDRVGLVVFGDRAYVAAPPSYDTEAVAQAVEGMVIGLAGRSTAIADGLGLALRRLSASDAPSRVVILLSDGANTAGDVDPVDAGALAAEIGVRVHTIALGPQSVSEGATSRAAVDDITLAAIARASGGTAFRVRSSADMAAVGAQLDRMETSPTDAPRAEAWRPLWVWPAAIALAAALALVLGDARPGWAASALARLAALRRRTSAAGGPGGGRAVWGRTGRPDDGGRAASGGTGRSDGGHMAPGGTGRSDGGRAASGGTGGPGGGPAARGAGR